MPIHDGLSSKPRTHVLKVQGGSRDWTENGERPWNLKVHPSGIPPPAMSQGLSLTKQIHQVGIKYHTAQDILIQTFAGHLPSCGSSSWVTSAVGAIDILFVECVCFYLLGTDYGNLGTRSFRWENASIRSACRQFYRLSKLLISIWCGRSQSTVGRASSGKAILCGKRKQPWGADHSFILSVSDPISPFLTWVPNLNSFHHGL